MELIESSSHEALKLNPTFAILEEITNSIMYNIIFVMYHWPILRNNLLYRFCIQFFCQKLHSTSKLIALGSSVINMKTNGVLKNFFCFSFTMMKMLGFNL